MYHRHKSMDLKERILLVSGVTPVTKTLASKLLSKYPDCKRFAAATEILHLLRR
jgi:hypothetical protein